MKNGRRISYSLIRLGLLFAAGFAQRCALAGPGDIYVGGDGYILQFNPDGTRSVFATFPGAIVGLACDAYGNVYAANQADYTIYKFASDGSRTTFATGSVFRSLAMDNQGHLLAASAGTGQVLRFNADGSYSTLVSGFRATSQVACDSSNNLFFTAANTIAYSIYKLTPDGVQSRWSGVAPQAYMTTDASGNLFVDRAQSIHKFTPDGTETIFSSDCGGPEGLAFDASGNLFEVDLLGYNIFKFAPDGTRITFATALPSAPMPLAIAPVPEPGMINLCALSVAFALVSASRLRVRKR